MTAEVDRPEAASSGSPFPAAPGGPDTAPVPAVDAPPETQPVAWRHRHLLDVDALTRPELELVMRTTDAMHEVLERPIPKVPALRGTSVTILFYEASTRTRVSFEVAAKNLSADVVNIAAASSSVSKGESLVDTVRTIEALGADMLVMRHPVSGVAVPRGGDLRRRGPQRRRRLARPPDRRPCSTCTRCGRACPADRWTAARS